MKSSKKRILISYFAGFALCFISLFVFVRVTSDGSVSLMYAKRINDVTIEPITASDDKYVSVSKDGCGEVLRIQHNNGDYTFSLLEENDTLLRYSFMPESVEVEGGNWSFSDIESGIVFTEKEGD